MRATRQDNNTNNREERLNRPYLMHNIEPIKFSWHIVLVPAVLFFAGVYLATFFNNRIARDAIAWGTFVAIASYLREEYRKQKRKKDNF